VIITAINEPEEEEVK
jgi:hypothetical protein